MKKILVLFSISIMAYAQLYTQTSCTAHIDNETCTDTIPEQAEVIATTVAKTETNSCFWMCTLSALTLWSTTSNVNIDMENLSTLNLSGSEITVWAKTPATINLDSCSSVLIYHEEGVVVNIDSSCIAVTTTTCGSVTFDYTLAPATGCFAPVNNKQLNDLTIYPNPSKGMITFKCGEMSGREVKIYIADMNGRMIYTEQRITDASGVIHINATQLHAGIYTAGIEGMLPKLLVVE